MQLRLGDDGYVTITGRKKELIINAAGKNMSPVSIEGAVLAASPLIAQAVAGGDRLGDHPAIRAAIGAAVDAANTRLSRVEQIKRFAILPTFWEADDDEITPTMKLKRRVITAKYANVIDWL